MTMITIITGTIIINVTNQ